MTNPSALLPVVEALARRAGALLVAMQDEDLAPARKEGRDIVTRADLASERLLIDGLRQLTPDAAILSEEAGLSDGAAQRGGDMLWILDPLDGTVNYASGLPWFSVAMALCRGEEVALALTFTPRMNLLARHAAGAGTTIDGRAPAVSRVARLADAVVSVMLTSSFSPDDVARTLHIIGRLGNAARGVRIVVSGALELALVACGRLDAFVSIRADAVSHAGGMAFVRAAGGRVSTLTGADAGINGLEKIASNGHLHDELLMLLGE